MRSVTKQETKVVETVVQVCDTCGQEKPLIIQGYWSQHCRPDNCYDDYGRFEFCSVACFLQKAPRTLEDLSPEPDTWEERLSIDLDDSSDEWPKFIQFLQEYQAHAYT